jgi:hypothetical protein
MLPAGLWQPWEPRAVFPVFADAENTLDFVVQDSLRPSLRSFARIGFALIKKQKSFDAAVRDGMNAMLGRGMAFRGAFVTRAGRYVGAWELSPPLQAGGFFSASVNRLLARDGHALEDGVFVLIASRGRLDRWSSSPGSATARYVGKNYVAGYRTGLFARPLNPVAGKRHFGFTGINPQVIVDGDVVASVLLINHSSDPEYDRSVSPTMRLYRDPANFLEAPFGEIPAHGGLERRLTDVFPDADRFLAAAQGRGYTITRASGASLASIHLLRSKTGRTLGMDHSRPAYTNVVD